MKYAAIALMCLLSAAIVMAGHPMGEAKSNPGFDKMKTLVGTWSGKDSEGKAVMASYKLVSAGTSIMEKLDMNETPEAMVTMYTANGEKLMMTHYCSMGNQPRMKTDKVAADASKMTFTMFDATNLASAKDAHMTKLIVMFKDADHFSQEWSMTQDGKVAHVAKFDFERSKQ